jgi:hypothetical protein
MRALGFDLRDGRVGDLTPHELLLRNVIPILSRALPDAIQ